MSNQGSNRKSQRKNSKSKSKSNEYIVPIKLECEVDSTSDWGKADILEKSSTSSDTDMLEQDDITVDDSSINKSLCESVNLLNVSSDGEETQEVCNVATDFVIPDRMLPPNNVPEKIIIVYDCAKDEISTGFQLKGESFTPTEMLKRSLRFFLHHKSMINPRHEFALVFLTENTTVWVKDFTNNIFDILRYFDDVTICDAEDIFNLNHLFELIDAKLDFNVINANNYIVRTVFIYGRSFTMPELIENALVAKILNSPYFTFDVLMTHEPPTTSNNCEKIFEALQNIDKKGFAYFFPVARHALDLHIAMAKLLSHPLQRPCQKVANYNINISEISK